MAGIININKFWTCFMENIGIVEKDAKIIDIICI